VRHIQRGELIRRQHAIDHLRAIKARSLPRDGQMPVESLGVVLAWLKRRNRHAPGNRPPKPPLIRRYAGSVVKHIMRSERLKRVCLLHRGRARGEMRFPRVVAGVGHHYPRNVVTPPAWPARLNALRRLRQR